MKMVRIWCVPCSCLDRQRLNGEHGELHVIFNALIKKRNGVKGGWQHHPQTLRFENHIGMLADRHNEQVREMMRRGYKHKTPLIIYFKYEPERYVYSSEEYRNDVDDLYRRDGLIYPILMC